MRYFLSRINKIKVALKLYDNQNRFLCLLKNISSKLSKGSIILNSDLEISPNLPIHRRLPLEMECEVFKCLTLPTQLKFITGLGKGIYGMFGPKIRALKKVYKLLQIKYLKCRKYVKII
jgi:hypothetical protein